MMLEIYFNIFEYIYNNIFFYYNIYITLYKFRIYFGFYFNYWENLFLYYIYKNKFIVWIMNPFLKIYVLTKDSFLWFNRRFLKKRKRFRTYYKFHNVRYWKLLLFFFYIKAFIIIWKRRNLYRKSQIVLTLIFLHIFILISLHFFMSIFTSFDLALLFCLFFSLVMMLLFNR